MVVTRLIAGTTLVSILDGGEGDDWVLVYGGEGAITIGGLDSGSIFNRFGTSENDDLHPIIVRLVDKELLEKMGAQHANLPS